ncbi:MAG TPA: beta-ketoacyl synthase N-terminal-like domain-containing protein, partial [Gemmatimonadales bacterium]|nr:beta-ketoacyl synthase N-terminal-like domain-containing protein [Gemmatimonadales bacterium]
MSTSIVFLSAVRTGFGAFGGTLKDLSATDLGAIAATCAIDRSGLAATDIGHVVIGNAQQTSADAIYLARHVGLRAGCAVETPALTVNRLCGSGFEAVTQAAQLIRLGEARAVLAGGTESMSQAPHVVRGARWGLKFGQTPPLEDSLWAALRDSQCDLPMAETAENLAVQYGIGRAEVDAYALQSQQRARDAWAAGAYADEVVPVPIADRKTKTTLQWAKDEGMRPDTSPDALAKLSPVFRKDGL